VLVESVVGYLEGKCGGINCWRKILEDGPKLLYEQSVVKRCCSMVVGRVLQEVW
jgi:hypothetical protein